MALPLAILAEKNKLASAEPWLILVKIPGGEGSIRIARNVDDVVFQGETYTAFSFELDVDAGSRGELPSVRLTISNVTRAFQYAAEVTHGAVGVQIILMVVHAGHLSTPVPDLELTLQIMSTSADAQWITFNLGAPNPLNLRCPQDRFLADYCRFKFKTTECGYVGGATQCSKTLAACRGYNNASRFGGFPGMQRSGSVYG